MNDATPQPPCPHEDRLGDLARGQQRLTKETDKQTGKIDRILDLLQGEDPLRKPGQGLVSKVEMLCAEKAERDERAAEIKRLAWGGASAGGLALAGVIGAWLKEWVKNHWH